MNRRAREAAGGRWRVPRRTIAAVGWLLLIVVMSSPNRAVMGGAGGSEDEARQCALPADGKANETMPVTYLPASRVDDAFSKGEPLLEVDQYKIHASRREGPGQAEIHTRDTDIMHVLQGSALLVTGGRAVDAKPTAPEELRGTSIAGGVERRIGPGDVVIIPGGVPHWFREVQAPLLYYVVKVRGEGGRPGGDA